MRTTLLNNRYQVIEVLGAGGFGETFLAEDTYMPSRRRCAIKQLKPIAANDPQTYKLVRQRFEREAATLENLGKSSDQIPELYAYFPENGQFYLVQEWIHGQTLTQIVAAKGLLNETTVREILLRLLLVLNYVHSKGIIHRDIKPDNIILRSSDGKPILIDFGAVKETIRSVVGTAGYPTQSLVMGTPGYMPSEQAIGRPVYATDIYSLGLTAIYLLTGKHPQELETNQQTGEILWLEYAPNVSPSFANILNQAIKPQAGDRYSTASKMLHALQSVSSLTPQSAPTAATIALNPVAAQKQTPPPPTQIKHNRNWRKSAWIVGGLVVGSLTGAVAIANLTRQPQSEVSIATSPDPETTQKASSATPTPTPETSVSTDEPADTPIASQPDPAPIIPTSRRQQPAKAAPVAPRIAATTQPETEQPRTSLDEKSDIPVPLVPDETPAATTPQPQTENQPLQLPTPDVSPPPKKSKKPPKEAIATTSIQSVPAFPTGTARSSVEAALGKPAKDLRGAWSNTRAVTYTLVPNQIDLGYLFDRNSGELRQTEAAFAQSVDPQVMQTTLEGMLGGQATDEIKQGLQQIQQRQKDNVSFTQGGLKGQIVRQDCDLIYISIWDANLHDFQSVSVNRKC
ncbi:serine/threonine protein kinase [Tolypothrix sp. NIES-4075]|uniref:serine/threonine-protein kinase n=1 Tax=Tolypothrix sp. NIES-4075 TaxID=2005459 RepID=UPI000B5CD116|nr:serine/threonine-protein kinase [Tolypothrix sp. NIES-4075]GAX42602.1 serine/threonine protein kinase [Tolypothrix sp. NIES-4075]